LIFEFPFGFPWLSRGGIFNFVLRFCPLRFSLFTSYYWLPGRIGYAEGVAGGEIENFRISL